MGKEVDLGYKKEKVLPALHSMETRFDQPTILGNLKCLQSMSEAMLEKLIHSGGEHKTSVEGGGSPSFLWWLCDSTPH